MNREGVNPTDEFHVKTIGAICAEFTAAEGVPIQSCYGPAHEAAVEVWAPYAASLSHLLSIQARTLHVAGVEALDGTPLLDIKTHIPAIDAIDVAKCGWFDWSQEARTRADDRFLPCRATTKEESK